MCQDTNYNGGFYALCATVADASKLKLTRATDSTHFVAGDYAAIYATTTGDGIRSRRGTVSTFSRDPTHRPDPRLPSWPFRR